MASQAEVDLIISTDDALPQLERDLTRIVRAAEAGADDIELEALLDTDASISNLISELSDVVAAATAAGDVIAVDATLDSIQSLESLQDDLSEVIHDASARAADIQLEAELDANEALLDAELTTLVNRLERDAPSVDLDVDVDRGGKTSAAVSRLGRAFSTLAPSLKTVAIGVGSLQALGSVAPLLAATAASLEAIAPASALAVSGLITVGLAAGTVKVAMLGVGDAVKSAFDPDVKPEELAKQLDALAPSARRFVVELSSMRNNLKAVQQDVQQKFFAGFDAELRGLGGTVLPVVAGALSRTSAQFNLMAIGASQAAQNLSKDGTLGQAFDASIVSLAQLRDLPAQFVKGLGQIGAAAGPSLERLAGAAGDAGTVISEKLSKAFESGGLENAINGSIDALKQLGGIAGNILGGLSNIMGTVNAQGGGLFATLERVTQAFQDVTATKGFQDALKALTETASVLVANVLPLITQALQILGPVFQTLAPPIQELVKALGGGLSKILTALGPVLVSLGEAFGKLVTLVIPFVDLAAQLISAILPALTPLFDALGQVFDALLPVVQQLVSNLAAQLIPVFTTLATTVLPQILPPLVELATKLFPLLADIMVRVAPIVATLGETFAKLLVALVPVIVEITNLAIKFLDDLMPVLGPLIDLILKLVNFALKILVAQINNIVIPALGILADLLRGDFSSAWRGAQDLVSNIAAKIGDIVGAMKDRVVARLREMAQSVVNRITEMKDQAAQKMVEFGTRLQTIASGFGPAIRTAVGNLGGILVQAGRDAVQGLINGLTERLGRLREIASDIASTVVGAVTRTLDSHSPSRVMRGIGQDTVEGFRLGISDAVPSLRKELQGVASLAPNFGMSGGQSLTLTTPQAAAPTVQVFLGNQLLDKHVDTRITMANKNRDRLVSQGVRR
jgi:phage-related protein